MSWNSSNKYIPGDWWVICERCGFKYRQSQMKKEWTGLLVCAKNCWEPRHPQDFLRSVPEKQPNPEYINPPNDADQIGQPGQITDNVTLTITDDPYQYIGHLDSDITITLDTVNFDDGDQFFIIKYGSSAYTVNVNSLYTIQARDHKKITVIFDTGSWILEKEETV